MHGHDSGGPGPQHILRTTLVVVVVAAVFGPALSRLAEALVPVVLVVGLVVAVLRVLWFYTNRW
jgi:hypothetical protein